VIQNINDLIKPTGEVAVISCFSICFLFEAKLSDVQSLHFFLLDIDMLTAEAMIMTIAAIK
jgi:hypothetical protein